MHLRVKQSIRTALCGVVRKMDVCVRIENGLSLRIEVGSRKRRILDILKV